MLDKDTKVILVGLGVVNVAAWGTGWLAAAASGGTIAESIIVANVVVMLVNLGIVVANLCG